MSPAKTAESHRQRAPEATHTPETAGRTSEQERLSPLGVYVHFPWCLKKCPYCDFLSLPAARQDLPHAPTPTCSSGSSSGARRSSAHAGLGACSSAAARRACGSPRELGRVLAGDLAALRLGPGRARRRRGHRGVQPVELRLPTRARALLDVGVNRVSIGVQSLDARAAGVPRPPARRGGRPGRRARRPRRGRSPGLGRSDLRRARSERRKRRHAKRAAWPSSA